jgi:hypothetical protein
VQRLLLHLVDRGIIRMILDSCASLRFLLASQTTSRPPHHSRCSGARTQHPMGMIKGPAVATTSGTAARTNRGQPGGPAREEWRSRGSTPPAHIANKPWRWASSRE